MDEVRIYFGDFTPRIQTQLEKYGLTLGAKASKMQQDADAITRLVSRGLISPEEGVHARKKLREDILAQVRPGRLKHYA